MAELDVKYYFAFQFVWFLVAWSAIAILLIEPKLKEKNLYKQLSFWVSLHLFRVLGVGLLVQNLSSGMPKAFALSTAIGDTITALLALCTLISLQKRHKYSLLIVWVFNLFGSLDLIYAMISAARVNAAQYLQSQWYVPALFVPLMLVSHVAVFRKLLYK